MVTQRATTERLTHEDVLDAVAALTPGGLPALMSHKRDHEISVYRQMAMILLRELFPNLSLSRIGDILARRDHTTVMYGVQQKDRLLRDSLWADEYVAIKSALLERRYRATTGYGASLAVELPPDIAPVVMVQRRPARVLASDRRMLRVEFCGKPPAGFQKRVTLSREAIEEAPAIGQVSTLLHEYLDWAKPQIEEGVAPDTVRLHSQRAMAALTAFLGGA